MTSKEEEKKIQIYSSSSSSSGRLVTPFWKEKYERDAKKYWDVFYRRHQDKFFKDRHYLDKEWGHYFQVEEGQNLVVLEVGCGAGNTIFPLLSTYPNIFIHACDFSPRAVDLVKQHKDYSAKNINAFVCDLTKDNLCDNIEPSSVDILTMIFVLSAVSPEKMPFVLQNIKRVLSPNGCVLFRDYASGDLAQERFTSKKQEISENFYVRGDGTRAYYFSEEFLTNLFLENGFKLIEIDIHNKQVENRSLELVMNRSWIQAVFTKEPINEQNNDKKEIAGDLQLNDIDLSDYITNLFNISQSQKVHEIIEIEAKGYNFKIKAVSKENQHTCKSTGLMIWESAHLMCNLLANNPKIINDKLVLELGTGSSGICSMVCAGTAKLVLATDGDLESLNLLKENISSNLDKEYFDKILVRKLIWGNKEDIKEIKETVKSFDVIIGTDVTYNIDNILPLFETARDLVLVRGSIEISSSFKELVLERESSERKPWVILCHIERRADEEFIIRVARNEGFELLDRWFNGVCDGNGIIKSWFLNYPGFENSGVKNSPLSILLFQLVV